jgi:hypothetical protein
MTDGPLLREEDFDSAVLREAAQMLNFIGRLAYTFRAPELLRFLGALAKGLARLESLMRSERTPRN